ncbi:MAG: PIN domain-containing protein [Lachnospiraceae bacterium]|nr:PIN domain-containing protein [Lachnospiraceae bacterium]
MKILIDTNVMLDFLTERESFFGEADKIMQMCKKKEIAGAVAAHSIMNSFFILRKSFSVNDRREMLRDYMKLVTVVGIDGIIIDRALQREDFSDVEDCLQDECALEFGADYIVTRNISDYKHSKVKAITPDEFLNKMSK